VRRRRSQRGYALISVIVGISLVLLTLLVASTIAQLGSRLISLQLNYQGQALNTANAGLIEGLDWFRRQTAQPVATFLPARDTSAVPPIDDTDVVTTPASIQRDFLISSPGRVWGHYEVTAGTAATGTGVLDLSKNRRGSSAMAGGVWQVESKGVIYVKNGTGAYNVSPNKVIATKTVRSEISRLLFAAPNSAISIGNGDNLNIGAAGAANARVVGGSGVGAICYQNCTLASPGVSVAAGATLSGTSLFSSIASTTPLDYKTVFGVDTLNDLAAMSDINVTSTASLPSPLPAMQLIYLNVGTGNTATFDNTTPLRGSGVLVVNGNLTVGGNSNWNGILYVMGNYVQTQPASVSGSVVVAGGQTPTTTATANLTGSGDFADLYYDPFIRTQVSQQIGLYRLSRKAYVPCPATDPLCQQRLSGNREVGY
jgi:hypothetical protein